MSVTLIGNKLKVEVLADESTKTQLTELNVKFDDLDSRVDTILTTPVESVSAQEIIDARQGEVTLGANITKVKSQLDERTTYNSPKMLNVGVPSDNKTVISFIDDDVAIGVNTRLLPIFSSKNVPFASAVITGVVGTSGYMTLAQLKECHETGLYETLSHTVNVMTNLKDGYTDEQLHYQFKSSQDWLKNNGFEYQGFVYPQSDHDLNIRKIMRQYYDYAFGKMGFNEKGYLNHNLIERIAFGSYTADNPTVNGNSEKNTLAYYKACVDYAVANKTWLIFMLHVSAQSVEQDAILGQLIDYIKSLNVEILKPSEAFKRKANKLSVGDVEENHIFIGESNFHMNIGDYQIVKLPNDRVGNGMSSDFYENDKLTYCLINNNVTNFPEQRPGVFITDKIVKDRQYAIQLYRVYKTGNTYERMINSDGSYSIWRSVKTNVKLDNNTVSSSSPITTFPKTAISYCLINNGDLGLPDGSAGVLETNTLIEDYGYCKQIFRKSNNRGVYERVALTATTYSDWVLVSNEVVSRKAIVSVSEITVPANSIVDTTVNLLGIKRATSWANAVPSYGLVAGIMHTTHILNDDSFTIRIQNTTASNVTVSARDWVIAYII